MNAEEFSKAMNKSLVESEKLHGSLINFGNLSQGLDSLHSTMQSMLSGIKELTAAYDVQMEAERKLEQVMQNTMNARAEDIQSIKDFCAAQQEIGIVGDEVQLAGAQELATYLELKGSLKSLIPVMNDMIAQQYGYNHSAENAAQIATMLGKVMQGQTGALSRYGYTFDEAQEKILKYGTEAERCAVLVDVVSASVGGMNQKLAQTDTGRMKQMENALGDIKEELGGWTKYAEQFLSIGANAAMAAMGVMKLVKGVQALTMAMRAATLAGGAITVVLSLLATAYLYLSQTTEKEKTELEKLTDAKERAKRAAEELAQAEEAENDARKSAESSLTLNIARLKDFNGTKAEEKRLVGEMNNVYGRTMGYFSSVAEWYNALIANSKAYCQQMVNEAKARMYANQIAQLDEENRKLIYNDDGSKKLYSTKAIYTGKKVYRKEKDGRHYYGIDWTSEKKRADEAHKLNRAKRANLSKLMEETVKPVEMPVMGSPEAPGLGGGKGTGGGSNSHEVQKTRLQEINELLSDLQDKWTTASDEERGQIKKTATALQQEKDGIELAIAAFKRPEALNTLRDIDAEIDYQRKLLAASSQENAASILTEIEALEEKREAFMGIEKELPEEEVKIIATDPSQAKTIGEINDAIQDLERKILEASAEEIEALQRSKMAFEEKKKAMELGIRLPQMQQEIASVKALPEQEQVIKIRDMGFEGLAEKIREIKALLADLDNPPTEGQRKALEGIMETYGQWQKKATSSSAGVADALKQAQSAFSGLGDAFEMPMLDVAGLMAGAVASMIQGYATATAQASSMGPIAWAAFALSGLAQLAAMISQVKGMGAFADGGIVSGPTLGLVGEYAGAKNNPEVIAPLNKLKSLIGDDENGANGRVEFEIRGDRLYGVLRKYERNKSRT